MQSVYLSRSESWGGQSSWKFRQLSDGGKLNAIVTTTINPPTKAIKLFDAMADWRLIVIGDKKTPPDYRLERGTYVPPAEQESYDKDLSRCDRLELHTKAQLRAAFGLRHGSGDCGLSGR